MGKEYQVIKVDVRSPFDPNASDERWAEAKRRIQEIANDPNWLPTNPFPEGGCVIRP